MESGRSVIVYDHIMLLHDIGVVINTVLQILPAL